MAALQTAADRVSAAILERRCNYWVRRLVPTFTPSERATLPLGYRYSMAQMELATDLIFKRSAPLKALFQRACELGVLVGGAERTSHVFGCWYYQTPFAKQYTRGDQHGDRILRAETCSNDTRHFGVGRRLDNLPLVRAKLAATNERCLALQADLLASTVDTGQLAALAKPTLVRQRRVPGLKLHDDRVIRLLETLLHPGAFATDWTSRELHARVLARYRLADNDYRLSQLRYALAKLRAKGLVERRGRTRRYRLTLSGAKIGVLLVKLRARLLGPLATLAAASSVHRPSLGHNAVDAAFHDVDTALDHLCAVLGLQHVA